MGYGIIKTMKWVDFGKDSVPSINNTSYEILSNWAKDNIWDVNYYTFDGKKYVYACRFRSKYKAKIYANRWRKAGYLARVVAHSDAGKEYATVAVRHPTEFSF